MNKLEVYLRECYAKTRWAYHGLLQCKQEVGESFEIDLQELKEKEIIRFRAGINGWLIEMINIETNWNINTQNK